MTYSRKQQLEMLKEKCKRCEGCPYFDKTDQDNPLCGYHQSKQQPKPIRDMSLCPKGLWQVSSHAAGPEVDNVSGTVSVVQSPSGGGTMTAVSQPDGISSFTGLTGGWKQWASFGLVGVMAGMLCYQTLILVPRQADLVRQDLMEERLNGRIEAERWRNEIRDMRAHDLEQRRATRELHREDMELYKKDMAVRSKEHEELIKLSSEILKAIKNKDAGGPEVPR